jgi:hypothetical protein
MHDCRTKPSKQRSRSAGAAVLCDGAVSLPLVAVSASRSLYAEGRADAARLERAASAPIERCIRAWSVQL